jgi:hypothetical protein
MASLIKRTWKNGPAWYIQYYVGNQQRRIRASDNFQIAKKKLLRFEEAQASGDDLPLPTRTPIAEIVTAYVEHIRQIKTAKSAQTDIYYLRDMFGPICDALKINGRKRSVRAKKRPPKSETDRRTKAPVIEAGCFEAIKTADIAGFISAQVARRGLAPKTANRYREILMRLFNWAMEQKNIRLPSDRNPAAKVERYKEPAPTIRFTIIATSFIRRSIRSVNGDGRRQDEYALRNSFSISTGAIRAKEVESKSLRSLAVWRLASSVFQC